jgi:hypothetical protein
VLAGIAATAGLETSTVVAVMTGAPTDVGPVDPEDRAPVRLGSYLDVRRFFMQELGLEPV